MSSQPTLPLPVASSRTTSSSTTTSTPDSLKNPSLDHTTISLPPTLPPKRPTTKRIWSYPFLSPHRRLIFTTILINLALLFLVIFLKWTRNLPNLGYIVISNLFLAIMIRQQRFVNLLFTLATIPRTHLPLSIRWALGKIYHFGGVHSGAAVSGAFWFLFFTVSATVLRAQNDEAAPSELLLFVTYLVLFMLLAIIALALPPIRTKHHNSFEATHRFLGWSVLVFVWVHTIFLIRDFAGDKSLTRAFFTSPTPYLLFVITLSIASTWVHLRKVPVTITKPSNHAIIATFENLPRKPFPGSSSAISLSPLYEWHSFANIPKPDSNSFRLIISRAGDWTSNIIDKPPTHVWIRGIPTAGVANIEVLFHKVLYVCTGSGIGPVLPHLLAKQVPASLFWSTRNAVDTYGQPLVDEIYDACPDAIVHDTRKLGKPDMVEKTYQLVKERECEAVIIISNQRLTRKVVYGMESRGIPAFGAIWDS